MKPYHRNPRQIKRKRLDRLTDTLARLGDLGGIVHNVTTDEVIGGNQRSKVFGEASAVEIVEKYDAPDEQGTVAHGFIVWRGKKFAYRQVAWDERTSEEANLAANLGAGEWDWDILANQFDGSLLISAGMDADMLKSLNTDAAALSELLKAAEGGDSEADAEPQVDRAEELREKWGVQTGQVWQIGNHRLMCGDSTSAEDVARLMGGERAHMMFTDPPYGVDYTGGHFHSGDVNIKRARERLSGDTDTALYAKFLPVALPMVDGPCYMWFADSRARDVYNAVHECGCEVHALIVWHKVNATYAAMNAQYKQRHEPCIYFKPRGSTLRWIGPTDECTVWDIKRDAQNEFHPTQKPIELAVRAVRNHDAPTVLDCFAGSGSTIIACENLGRRARAMDKDEGYVAVALQRWADATGKTPVLSE